MVFLLSFTFTLLFLTIYFSVRFRITKQRYNELENNFTLHTTRHGREIMDLEEEIARLKEYNFRVGGQFFLPEGKNYRQELLGKRFIIRSIEENEFKVQLVNSSDLTVFTVPISYAPELIYISNKNLKHTFI